MSRSIIGAFGRGYQLQGTFPAPSDAGTASFAVILHVECAVFPSQTCPLIVGKSPARQQSDIGIHFVKGLHSHRRRVNVRLVQHKAERIFRTSAEMSASQCLHGKNPDTHVMCVTEHGCHIGFRTVRDTDSRHIVQGMAHVRVKSVQFQADQSLHERTVVCGCADSFDDSFFPAFKQVLKRIPVTAQRIVGLLLMEHENVDHIPVESASGFIHRFCGKLPGPCVGLR